MSQDGAEKIIRACPDRMDSEKLSLEAKDNCRKKGGSFFTAPFRIQNYS
jgi:hypothetical protein